MKKYLNNSWGAFFFRLVVSIALLFLVFWGIQKKLGNQENLLLEIKCHFQNFHWGFFLLAVSIFFSCTFVATFRMYLLTRIHQIDISYRKLLKNIYIGFFFNLILLGATGGDIVRSLYLCRETEKKTEIVTVLFLDRFLGLTVLTFLTLVVLSFHLSHPLFKTLFMVIAGFLGLLFLIAILSSSDFFSRSLHRLKHLPWWGLTIHEIGEKIVHVLKFSRKEKKILLLASGLTLYFQSASFLSIWIASRSFSNIPPIPLKYFFLFLPVIFTISSLPISVGGLGVGEAAFVTLFALAGVSETDSLTISLLNRIILGIGALIGGLIYILPSTARLKTGKIF